MWLCVAGTSGTDPAGVITGSAKGFARGFRSSTPTQPGGLVETQSHWSSLSRSFGKMNLS